MGLFDSVSNFVGSAAPKLLSQLPVVGGMFDNSGQQALDQLANNQAVYQGVGIPDQKWQNYNPESMTPELAQASQISEDPTVRSAQLSALSKMGDLANTGLTAVDQQGYQQARDIGNQMAHSGSQAALQNAQARGIGGSGMEFANREIANQEGAGRAQQAGLAQAADSARGRANALQAYGAGLGQQRAQDFNANAANTGILNQFNMANTQAQNAANQWNVQNRNNAQQYNQQGQLNLGQQNFNNQITKAGGMAQANTGMAQGYAAQNAARTSDRNMWTKIGANMISSKMGGQDGAE